MMTKLIFVLVLFTNDGKIQHFAQFKTQTQCESFAKTFNSSNSSLGRAVCMPENVRAEVDIDQAISKMASMMNKMKQEMEKNETVSNQRPTP
jgi:hypothetical protein